MLSNSLILLSTMAFFLTALSVLLSESQQRRLVDWNVRVWAAIDGYREHLKTKRLFKIVLEEPLPTTTIGTVACFVGGLVGISLFGGFCVLSTCALLGAILCHQDATSLEARTAGLIWLYGVVALTGLLGFFESIRMYLLSVCAFVTASILVSVFWMLCNTTDEKLNKRPDHRARSFSRSNDLPLKGPGLTRGIVSSSVCE